MTCSFTHTAPLDGSLELPVPLRGLPQDLALSTQITRFDSAGTQYTYYRPTHGTKSMPLAWAKLPMLLTLQLLDFIRTASSMHLVVWTDHTGTDSQVRFSPDPVRWKQVSAECCQVEIRLIGDAFADTMVDENGATLTDENGDILTW